MRHKIALALTVLTVTSQTALGAGTNLIINNRMVETTVNPEQVSGTTLVPIRVVSEEMGAEVKWDKTTQTITILKDERTITLKIGSKQGKVNDVTSTLLVAPILKNGTTMVPLRFISESLDVPVEWDNAAKTVLVNTAKTAVIGTVKLDEIDDKFIQIAEEVLSADVVCIGKFDKEGKEYYKFSPVAEVGARVIINEDAELFDSYIYEEDGTLVMFQQ